MKSYNTQFKQTTGAVSPLAGQADVVRWQILGEVQKRKLIKSKAVDFSNVLRRTLSTSEQIRRLGRGVYGV